MMHYLQNVAVCSGVCRISDPSLFYELKLETESTKFTETFYSVGVFYLILQGCQTLFKY